MFEILAVKTFHRSHKLIVIKLPQKVSLDLHDFSLQIGLTNSSALEKSIFSFKCSFAWQQMSNKTVVS